MDNPYGPPFTGTPQKSWLNLNVGDVIQSRVFFSGHGFKSGSITANVLAIVQKGSSDRWVVLDICVQHNPEDPCKWIIEKEHWDVVGQAISEQEKESAASLDFSKLDQFLP